MTETGALEAEDLRRIVALHSRLCRCEETFNRWRRMPDYHEAEAARRELRVVFGFEIPPGEGWDGPPVIG